MSGTFQGRVAFAAVDVSPLGFANQSGDFESVANPNPGDFTLTLKNPIDPSEAVYFLEVMGKDGERGQVWRAACTDTTIQVFTRNAAGALSNEDFDLLVLVKPVQ
jgi:hypothetical protein